MDPSISQAKVPASSQPMAGVEQGPSHDKFYQPAESIASSSEEMSIPLIEACADGRLRDITTLLEAGANPNCVVEEPTDRGVRMITPMLACLSLPVRDDATPKVARAHAMRAIKLLLDKGANFSFGERELLVCCVRHGLADILDFLLDSGARVSPHAYELLDAAYVWRRFGMIESLRARGVEANAKDASGSTPFLDICVGKLSRAAMSDPIWAERSSDESWYVAQFMQMIAAGADIDARDRVGATGIMRAIAAQEPAIARALVRCGADCTMMLRNGVSTMHLAAHCGNRELLRLMMAAGAPVSEFRRLRSTRLQPDIKAMIQSAMKEAGLPAA